MYMANYVRLVVINCGNLTDPDDGQVAFTPGVVATIDTGFGATAAYTCIEGYSLLGNSVRTCQEIGVWDGAEPTCMCKYIGHTPIDKCT